MLFTNSHHPHLPSSIPSSVQQYPPTHPSAIYPTKLSPTSIVQNLITQILDNGNSGKHMVVPHQLYNIVTYPNNSGPSVVGASSSWTSTYSQHGTHPLLGDSIVSSNIQLVNEDLLVYDGWTLHEYQDNHGTFAKEFTRQFTNTQTYSMIFLLQPCGLLIGIDPTSEPNFILPDITESQRLGRIQAYKAHLDKLFHERVAQLIQRRTYSPLVALNTSNNVSPPLMNIHQQQAMLLARKLHEYMGHPYEEGLIRSVKFGGVTGCPLTPDLIRFFYRRVLPAEPCNICTLAKLSEPNTFYKKVTMDHQLYIDTMFVRGVTHSIPLLIMLDSITKNGKLAKLKENTASEIKDAILPQVTTAKSKGHPYDGIVADPDRPTGAAIKMLRNISDFGSIADMKVPTKTHLAEAEQFAQVSRRKIRLIYAEFQHTYGVPMPIECEALAVINAMKKAMHIVSTRTADAVTPAVLDEEPPISFAVAIMVKAGDIIIGYTTQGDLRGQYAIVVDHTFQSPCSVTCYNLDSETFGRQTVVYASFKRANPDKIPKYIIDKIRAVSTRGRAAFKLHNTRTADRRRKLEQRIEAATSAIQQATLQAELLSLPPVCESIDEDDNDSPPPLRSIHTDPNDRKDDNATAMDRSHADTQPNEQPPFTSSTSSPTPTSSAPTSTANAPVSPTLSQLRKSPTLFSASSIKQAFSIKSKSQVKAIQRVLFLHEVEYFTSGYEYLLHLSINKAYKQHPTEQSLIDDSIIAEWIQLLLNKDPTMKEVLLLLPPNTSTKGKVVIPSLGFLKRKLNKVTTLLEKWKYRVAASGDKDNTPYDKSDTSSPTIDHPALLLFLSVMMRKEGVNFSTTDFPGAYLATELDQEIYMTIDKNNADILLKHEKFQHLHQHVRSNGSILTKVQRSIYGLKTSGKAWYDKLVQILDDFGMKPLSSNKCIFQMPLADGKFFYVAIYVDDLMMATNDISLRDQFMTYVKKEFPTIELCTGDKLPFLGMSISFDYTNKIIRYNNTLYIQELCEKYDITTSSAYPYDHSFLEDDESSPAINTTDYKSITMQIFYVAKRTRPDVLFPISVLATKSSAPTMSHFSKAIVILQYLYGTKDLSLTHRCSGTTNLNAYIDASYAIHPDAKSHTGSIIRDGTNVVSSSSSKQKVVANSSTGAEINSVYEKFSSLHQTRELYMELTGDTRPTVIFQDNTSAMHLMENGDSASNKSRHMRVRYFFVKEHIDNEEIELQHMPTQDMIADLLTKPLFGQQFTKLLQLLFNDIDSSFSSILFTFVS